MYTLYNMKYYILIYNSIYHKEKYVYKFFIILETCTFLWDYRERAINYARS